MHELASLDDSTSETSRQSVQVQLISRELWSDNQAHKREVSELTTVNGGQCARGIPKRRDPSLVQQYNEVSVALYVELPRWVWLTSSASRVGEKLVAAFCLWSYSAFDVQRARRRRLMRACKDKNKSEPIHFFLRRRSRK